MGITKISYEVPDDTGAGAYANTFFVRGAGDKLLLRKMAGKCDLETNVWRLLYL